MTVLPLRQGLLLACYEMGRQPLSLAWPLAVLAQAGLPVRAFDLSLETPPTAAYASAAWVGISVPMHTALRLGVQAARQIRQTHPDAHICFYGLYAWLNAEYLFGERLADSVIAGEYEAPLLSLARAVYDGQPVDGLPGVRTPRHTAAPHIQRIPLPTPQRAALPSLDRYARLENAGGYALAGYTETTRGCLHTCRHCPVVPVYQGRFFAVPVETVLADIRQQAAEGAAHISFGDPDFLNGPGHALKVARAMHAEFPYLTFDFTTKVEHVIKHAALFPELRALGALFAISAFESVSDHVLEQLDKGHTAADLDRALDILAGANITVQPTWVPFTPWTSIEDYLDLLAWIRSRNLFAQVPAVQLSIRLLVPPHSHLLTGAAPANWLGTLDAANFTHTWQHPDPRMDALQQEAAALAEEWEGAPAWQAFAAIEQAACRAAGRPLPAWDPTTLPAPTAIPRLTENWFC